MPHICPWWLTYTFDNPLRRFLHDPHAILRPYVRPGMTAADLGCGMGYFTVALADLVGPGGRVYAVDMQPRQLRVVEKRCRKAGVMDRVELVQAREDSLLLKEPLDFVLGFWVAHEVPDGAGFFRQIDDLLAKGGKALIVEPKLHVSRQETEDELTVARGQGLTGRMLDDAVRISWSFELARN